MDYLTFLCKDLPFTEIALSLVVFVLIYHWYRRPKHFPPGPRGFPFLGVVPWVGKYPERTFAKWSKTYGPIMSAQLGTKKSVVLNDYESILEAFGRGKEAFSGRPYIPVFQQFSKNHGIVFIDNGPKWKSQRKFGSTMLRGYGIGKRGMEERVQEEVEYLCKAVQEQKGKPFDILDHLTNAVSNNICSVVCGKRFEYDDKLFTEVISRLNANFTDPKMMFAMRIFIFIPLLMKVPPLKQFNETFMSNMDFVIDFLKQVIAEHKATFDKENPHDFIDAFIQEMEKGKDEHFTEAQLLQFILNLFVAGTEPTTSTLRWSILCMIHYPDTQKKLHEEIRKVVGSARVSMQYKADMAYTSAFIEEIYRFRTLAPLGLPHKTKQNVTINGHFIPENTQIFSNLWAVHNDPKNFKNPNVFRPERHLDDKGMFVKSGQVIPFSVGPRHCLGEQLARMEVFMFLVSLVQKFEFKANPNESELPDITSSSGGQLFVPLPFIAVAKER